MKPGSKQSHVLLMMKNELTSIPMLCPHDDSTLLRFLAANEYDISDTVDALSIYDKWKYNFASIVSVIPFPEIRHTRL